MPTIIIISLLVGAMFAYWAHKLDFGSYSERGLWECISFFLSALFSYIVLFHIFLK